MATPYYPGQALQVAIHSNKYSSVAVACTPKDPGSGVLLVVIVIVAFIVVQ
jgi:hypothetical protein